MDGWHAAPSVFPNVLTALVTAMSIALVSVLVVLVRDNRRRLSAEHDLGDALAFRKAMEDSAGHRPARARHPWPHHLREPGLCAMVGFHGRGAAGPGHAALLAARACWNTAERQMSAAGGSIRRARAYESTFMRARTARA